MANQWSKAEDPPGNIGVGNIKAAIAFSLFSIFTWVSICNLMFLQLSVKNILPTAAFQSRGI